MIKGIVGKATAFIWLAIVPVCLLGAVPVEHGVYWLFGMDETAWRTTRAHAFFDMTAECMWLASLAALVTSCLNMAYMGWICNDALAVAKTMNEEAQGILSTYVKEHRYHDASR